jgi:3-hydroxyisobutyrate dehydrogenase-like beta-hydroxyacid dehydrogenase
MRLLVFGLGYVGLAVAREGAAAGLAVVGTTRSAGVDVAFAEAAAEVARATHVLSTVPPDKSGDPVLERYADALAKARYLHWIGYLSTTGV